MSIHNDMHSEHRLDSMFRAYRDSCDVPEPGANFMPEIWRRIEARQSVSLIFRRMAAGFVTAAAGLSMAMAVFLIMPAEQPSPFYNNTYVEVLAAQHQADMPEIADGVDLLHAEGDQDDL